MRYWEEQDVRSLRSKRLKVITDSIIDKGAELAYFTNLSYYLICMNIEDRNSQMKSRQGIANSRANRGQCSQKITEKMENSVLVTRALDLEVVLDTVKSPATTRCATLSFVRTCGVQISLLVISIHADIMYKSIVVEHSALLKYCHLEMDSVMRLKEG